MGDAQWSKVTSDRVTIQCIGQFWISFDSECAGLDERYDDKDAVRPG